MKLLERIEKALFELKVKRMRKHMTKYGHSQEEQKLAIQGRFSPKTTEGKEEFEARTGRKIDWVAEHPVTYGYYSLIPIKTREDREKEYECWKHIARLGTDIILRCCSVGPDAFGCFIGYPAKIKNQEEK